MFFRSVAHKQRFLTAIQQMGKVFDGTLDPEYGAAFYILTADLHTWQNASSYMDREGIDFAALLQEVDFSGGYQVLLQLACNLFNSQMHLDPVELMRLDESNFTLALVAIQIRRYSLKLSELTKGEGSTS